MTREGERVCVCVCCRERGVTARERERESMCVCVVERVWVCACACGGARGLLRAVSSDPGSAPPVKCRCVGLWCSTEPMRPCEEAVAALPPRIRGALAALFFCLFLLEPKHGKTSSVVFGRLRRFYAHDLPNGHFTHTQMPPESDCLSGFGAGRLYTGTRVYPRHIRSIPRRDTSDPRAKAFTSSLPWSALLIPGGGGVFKHQRSLWMIWGWYPINACGRMATRSYWFDRLCRGLMPNHRFLTYFNEPLVCVRVILQK